MAPGPQTTLLIVIVSAGAFVMLGFAIWRICFFNPRDDPSFTQQMSNEQKEYMSMVRDRNRHILAMEAQGARV
jgi:hypothetical protein